MVEESECHNEAETRITKPGFESEVGGDSGKRKRTVAQTLYVFVSVKYLF